MSSFRQSQTKRKNNKNKNNNNKNNNNNNKNNSFGLVSSPWIHHGIRILQEAARRTRKKDSFRRRSHCRPETSLPIRSGNEIDPKLRQPTIRSLWYEDKKVTTKTTTTTTTITIATIIIRQSNRCIHYHYHYHHRHSARRL